MSQAFTRILDNQSNKLLANLPVNDTLSVPIVQSNPNIQTMPQNLSPLKNIDEGLQEYKIIKLFGYDFTIYTLILIVVLLVCVGYFLYKYFFTKTDLVVYKKNIKKDSKKNKEKNKEEFSNNSNSSNISNESGSSTIQTL